MANRLGYRYFLKSFTLGSGIDPIEEEYRRRAALGPDSARCIQPVQVSETLIRGTRTSLKLAWENRGVAPAYHKFTLAFKLTKADEEDVQYTQILQESDNRNWMPGCIVGEKYWIDVPEYLSPGLYKVGISLYEEVKNWTTRYVELPFIDEIHGKDHFYYFALANIQ